MNTVLNLEERLGGRLFWCRHTHIRARSFKRNISDRIGSLLAFGAFPLTSFLRFRGRTDLA